MGPKVSHTHVFSASSTMATRWPRSAIAASHVVAPSSDASLLAASVPYGNDPADEFSGLGFRVTSLVPEPDAALLGMTAALGLAPSRRRRSN